MSEKNKNQKSSSLFRGGSAANLSLLPSCPRAWGFQSQGWGVRCTPCGLNSSRQIRLQGGENALLLVSKEVACPPLKLTRKLGAFPKFTDDEPTIYYCCTKRCFFSPRPSSVSDTVLYTDERKHFRPLWGASELQPASGAVNLQVELLFATVWEELATRGPWSLLATCAKFYEGWRSLTGSTLFCEKSRISQDIIDGFVKLRPIWWVHSFIHTRPMAEMLYSNGVRGPVVVCGFQTTGIVANIHFTNSKCKGSCKVHGYPIRAIS